MDVQNPSPPSGREKNAKSSEKRCEQNEEAFSTQHRYVPIRCKPSFTYEQFPEEAALIIGAGHFGRRAARILSHVRHGHHPIFIVDRDKDGLNRIEDLAVEKIMCDGIGFLVDNFPLISPSNIIVPAVPVHLAFEWLLKSCLDDEFGIKQIDVPEEIKRFLPHTWEGNEGSLLISYADFCCPDDCPEPAGYCTVTGRKRDIPLYDLLSRLNLLDFKVHAIRSRQLAPGLGGYRAEELRKLISRIKQEAGGRWLVSTSCRCHGTVTAMAFSEIKEPTNQCLT